MGELATQRPPTKAELDQAYAAILDGKPLPQVSDPEVVSRAILERILTAETFEDAFAPQELTSWRDLLDVPVFVRSFHLNSSGFEQGSSVYAVCDLQRADGANWDDGRPTLTVTCGGRNVLAQLVKMLEKGWLDRPVAMIAKRTREGFDALWLESATNPLDE